MDVWNFIHDKYTKKVGVVLLYVLESTGSSPGRQGFKMAVGADNSFTGSIGGGIMEYKFVEMAKAILVTTAAQKQDTFRQIHSKDSGANQSGMICSGEQTIWFHLISDLDASAVSKILNALENHLDASVVLSPSGIEYSPEIIGTNFYYKVNGEDFLLKEKIGFKNILHIIGGGHCALALSRLMSQMDFYIHLYDDRKELDTIGKNTFVHEIHLVESYSDISSFIKEGQNVFVVIMTFGYRTDDLAVRSLMDKAFAYTGIMGSKKKIQQMFQAYDEEGISEMKIQGLHAPIGLDIKSQSPEEIAVSIAAEIIQVKNRIL